MPIALYRVDDRLIHGQVVEGWVPELKINVIAVISDDIFKDELRKNIMRFSAPENIKLDFLNLESAVNYLKENINSKYNVLVLFSNLKDVVGILESGVEIKSLNIGGMHYSAGKNISLGKAIFLSDEDKDYLRAIEKKGVKIEGRGIPQDTPLDILESINL
jgi:PTS system mannose-specific IIB component